MMRGVVRRTASSFWVVGVLSAAVLAAPRPARSQFTSFSTNAHKVLEGNWQSCREADGRYSERIYDHVVNGVAQFEVHMGPRLEFAIFKGVQDEHRAHASADNLLKPHVVAMSGNRASRRWEIPSLGLTFTVTLAGGSRTDCESWYVLLEPFEKTSD